MKVVINKCYGGYNLSNLAVQKYVQYKNLKFFTKDDGYGNISYYKIDVKEYEKELAQEKKLLNENSKEYKGHLSNRHCWGFNEIARHDNVLIKVIEELGELANGECAKLKIVEIPDNVKYKIDDYDGCESIHEKHRIWS